MINNLELVLCAENCRDIDKLPLTNYPKTIVNDILPDTSDDKLISRLPFLPIKSFKRVA